MTGTDTNATAQAPDDGVTGMDAPERIWAVPLEVNGAVMVGGWADTIRQCPNGTEYVRADIHAQTLATPPALVASPEVQALVEAANSARDSLWFSERELRHYGCVPSEDCDLLQDRLDDLTTALATYRTAKEAANG
jgi:hypothetical protein